MSFGECLNYNVYSKKVFGSLHKSVNLNTGCLLSLKLCFTSAPVAPTRSLTSNCSEVFNGASDMVYILGCVDQPHPLIGVTPIDSQLRPYSVNGQRPNQSNRCSQRSKRSQKDGQRSDPSAVIRSKPVGWGYTCTKHLFPDLQAHGLGLQIKYQDSFAGKISERSKVNGQKLAWSTVKPPKRAGQSFDPRSQL